MVLYAPMECSESREWERHLLWEMHVPDSDPDEDQNPAPKARPDVDPNSARNANPDVDQKNPVPNPDLNPDTDPSADPHVVQS